jgi:formate dehydrogenase major subunit
MLARISGEVKPGVLYCTFHFPEVLVNIVTSSECDEDTMCPEYKVVAVDVEKARSKAMVGA